MPIIIINFKINYVHRAPKWGVRELVLSRAQQFEGGPWQQFVRIRIVKTDIT